MAPALSPGGQRRNRRESSDAQPGLRSAGRRWKKVPVPEATQRVHAMSEFRPPTLSQVHEPSGRNWEGERLCPAQATAGLAAGFLDVPSAQERGGQHLRCPISSAGPGAEWKRRNSLDVWQPITEESALPEAAEDQAVSLSFQITGSSHPDTHKPSLSPGCAPSDVSHPVPLPTPRTPPPRRG